MGESTASWQLRFGESAPAPVVVAAWLQALDTAARAGAEADPPVARNLLRQQLVELRNSAHEPARATAAEDASAGFKYLGAIIRALDAALGVAPIVRAAAASAPGRPTALRVLAGEGGKPGTLGLYWSNWEAARDANALIAQGITHRLNVAAEAVSSLSKDDGDGLVTAHVRMEDRYHEDHGDSAEDAQEAIAIWASQLQQCLAQLRRWREDGAVVNINCQMGKNRSGAAVAMWLIAEAGWELLPTVTHLREISSLSLGNPHLNVALAEALQLPPGVTVPLNPATDGGSFVCISPPGSPKAQSRAASPVAAAAAPVSQPAREVAEMTGEENDALADLADLLGEI